MYLGTTFRGLIRPMFELYFAAKKYEKTLELLGKETGLTPDAWRENCQNHCWESKHGLPVHISLLY
jgi:hypothetical protein